MNKLIVGETVSLQAQLSSYLIFCTGSKKLFVEKLKLSI